MSLFDYPRIHVKGTVQMNPGTANNDDYAGAVSLPSTFPPPYAGQTLALIDSKLVEPRTYGMPDSDFVSWIQKAQTFDVTGSPGKTMQIVPAEWNYYGDLGTKATAAVTGVQTADAYQSLDSVNGATLTYSGSMCDVNSEGSPPATQFFIEQLTLTSSTGQILLQGKTTKGVCQWINFYRNVNLTADGGAGGYVYCLLLKDTPKTVINIPGYDDPRVKGVIFRYYVYRTLQGVTDNKGLEELYANAKTNPATLQITGTFAPLHDDETILTGPVGRLLIKNDTTIPTPDGTRNNGNKGKIALAPAVLRDRGTKISADFVATFPDYFKKATDGSSTNDKYDFGAVTLYVTGNGSEAEIGAIDYADTAAGDAVGWIFDFDLSANEKARNALTDPEATFSLVSAKHGNVLGETEYYVVSNQQAIYGEQHGPRDAFRNQGTVEPATVFVYRRGKELSPYDCPPITVWAYASTPLQKPGNAIVVAEGFRPGDPICIDTSQPGNWLLTFTVGDTPPPPESYGTFMFPPWVTNAPSMSLRLLPNGDDFSRYYVDPYADDPTGNDSLTFDVVFQHALRPYYLLFPAMNKFIPLNQEDKVAAKAGKILAVTEYAMWTSIHYMPRTRDLSESRRKLLRAWCKKVAAG